MNPAADSSRLTVLHSPPLENSLGSDHLYLLNALRELAASFGLPVYLVGGPVRDWLLGLPGRDLDFVVEGDAPSLARILAGKVGGRVTVHDRFGTATVILDETRIDLVTARSEAYPVPGALPVVKPSTIREDLARRDFTINAMALPLGGGVDSLEDPFYGISDLKGGLIRTVHPLSFVDDPTRLFRAVRYEQRLGFRLEAGTKEQFLVSVKARHCDTVSGDRLRHELERILDEASPEKVLTRAAELGLLSAVALNPMAVETVSRWAKVVESDTGVRPTGHAPWLAALAYSLSVTDGEHFIRRLNLRASWAKTVRDVIVLRGMESSLGKPGLPASELFRMLEGIDEESIAACAALTDSPKAAENLKFYQGELRNVATVLKGGDLLDLGVPPGPTVGRALAMLRNARLDRQVGSEEEERLWVKNLVSTEYSGSVSRTAVGNSGETGGGQTG